MKLRPVNAFPLVCAAAGCALPGEVYAPVPVVFQTDIGDAVDDAWALALLLRSPGFDLRLVLVDAGRLEDRARVAGKLLAAFGRADIPIALGVDLPGTATPPLAGWAADYRLALHPGGVLADGPGALIEVARREGTPENPLLVLAAGPMPAIGKALERSRAWVRSAVFAGMCGSIDRDPEGRPGRVAEWNAARAPEALARVLEAPWPVAIAPLDVAAEVELEGPRYARVAAAARDDPAVGALLDAYRAWLRAPTPWRKESLSEELAERRSGRLYDLAAVALAFDARWLEVRGMGIRIDQRGFTLPDSNGRRVCVARGWKDLEGFLDFVAARLGSRSPAALHAGSGEPSTTAR